jgi:PAS domain S-box-containing protein
MNTEDRHVEIALSLFREANDAFFLFDPQTQIVIDINPAAQRLTGLDKSEARSMRLEELFDSTGTARFDQLALAMRRTGFFHSREGYFLRRKAADALPVNVSVSRIHTEPKPIGLVVARDISDRKRAEESLRQVETRYSSLVACTGVVVWETDDKGVHISLSPAFESITGWKRSHWIGRPFDALFHPDDREIARAWHNRALRGEPLPRFELRVRTRSGDYLNCEYLLVTRVQEGSESRILGITRDITEEKQIEKELEQARDMRRAKEAAEQANRAKSEFLSSVSHEIRTPLTAVLGFTELLDEHPYIQEGPDEVREYLVTIRENGRVLLALIDDLLDISRIEAGQLRVECEACSLPQIVTDAVESFRAKAETKRLQLDSGLLGATPPFIATDRLRLQQILANLLDNAVKFTERGTVRLTARTITEGHAGSGPVVQFEVSDTGIGMSQEELPGLFQPFYRVRSAASGGPSGTGLGLAICQRLATRLGGEITVQSTPGVGTTFSLTIPAGLLEDHGEILGSGAGKLGDSRSLKSSVLPSPALHARILLAEDNDANRQIIGLRLSRAGAEVVAVRNGKEALDRVREETEQGRPINAVIMDMEMPVLDGYEAVRRLRAGGFTAPILAVTAYAMSKDREECLDLGCDDHFSKPIEWDRFFLKLSELMASANELAGE